VGAWSGELHFMLVLMRGDRAMATPLLVAVASLVTDWC
jgi:hypothetical protein